MSKELDMRSLNCLARLYQVWPQVPDSVAVQYVKDLTKDEFPVEIIAEVRQSLGITDAEIAEEVREFVEIFALERLAQFGVHGISLTKIITELEEVLPEQFEELPPLAVVKSWVDFEMQEAESLNGPAKVWSSLLERKERYAR